jgi:hypothetical protein
MGMRIDRGALEDLRAKYLEMLSMRMADDEELDDESRVRVRMRGLARQFPGALREIDDLPLDEIRRRIEALEAVLAGRREVESWMEAVARFHGLLRGALVAKRWLGRRKHVDEAVRELFVRELPVLPFPEDSRAWTPHLATVASPPRGRLLDAVFGRLAREMSLPEAIARQLVLGEADTSE